MGEVLAATDVALAAASHLTAVNAGAVAALRQVAARVDADDPRDNVSLPTYLRFCESLGLTPGAKAKASPDEGKGASGGTKLAHLRSLHTAPGPKSKAGKSA